MAISPALSTAASLSFEENVENVDTTGVVPAKLNKITKIGDKYMIEGDINDISSGRNFSCLQYAISTPGEPYPIVLKFLIEPFDLIAFPILAMVLSMIAGVYPVHRASQLNPVVALRG